MTDHVEPAVATDLADEGAHLARADVDPDKHAFYHVNLE